MSHPDYFLLGKIHKTHGVKGDFSISLDTDSPSRYKSLKLVYLEVGDTLK
jgi:ribosomal 30S subunit maturation factor RimM